MGHVLIWKHDDMPCKDYSQVSGAMAVWRDVYLNVFIALSITLVTVLGLCGFKSEVYYFAIR